MSNFERTGRGLKITDSGSAFTLWAPTAEFVTLYLYNNAGDYRVDGTVDHSHPDFTYPMHFDAQTGLWTLHLEGNHRGMYYLYAIKHALEPIEFQVDLYARAVSANGQRTYICESTMSDPPGFRTHEKPSFINATDAVIYEVHVRDFSMDSTSGIENKGKFLAFTERGTKTPKGAKTGLDHLIDLGVTHVQILPVHDFQSVNELLEKYPESQEGDLYNWGYDPQHFRTIEGSYAIDPEEPLSRVRELKRLVQSLHEAGIRVILDLVYNHSFKTIDGPFEKQVPGFAYRYMADGSLANGSGTGNEIRSESDEMRRYLIDSVLYLLEEFKVDGFRFDLMGLIDVDTMYQLEEEVHAHFGEDILLLGEPWQAGGSPLAKDKLFDKGKQNGRKIAVFNDHFRTAIKGTSDSDIPGFALGGLDQEEAIVSGLRASIDDFAKEPQEVIQYVTAHDNLILWDKILRTLHLEDEAGLLDLHEGRLMGKSRAQFSSFEEAVQSVQAYFNLDAEHYMSKESVRRHLLAYGLVMTSQGISFMHAGDEFLRTKFGDHNSYRSPDAINAIRWSNKDQFPNVYTYFKGLIRLRKEHPAFRMTSREMIETHLNVHIAEDQLVMISLSNHANGDAWQEIVCVYNASMDDREILLPREGPWNMVVNQDTAGVDVIMTVEESLILIEKYSMLVLYKQ